MGFTDVTVPRRNLLTVVVALVTLALTLAAVVIVRSVVAAQESTLLTERQREFVALVQSAGAERSAALRSLADASLVPGDAAFLARGRQLAAEGAAVGVARLTPAGLRDVRVVESDGTRSTGLTAAQRAIVERGSRTDQLAYAVTDSGGARHFLHALRVDGPTPMVAFRDAALPDAIRPVSPSPASPYQDVNVAVYVGDRAVAGQLIVLAGDPPAGDGSQVSRQVATIGADQVLVEVSARAPLVGQLAACGWWAALIGGLLLTALLTLLVHVLGRRRDYALTLVEVRTRETRAAQEAAEAANQSKSEFLSRVSHELRTPLHAVLGYSQLLAMDELSDDQAASVQQIERGGKHLLELINEILDITTIESGRLPLTVREVQVFDLVSSVAELLGPVADAAGVRLVGPDTDADDAGSALADDQRLTQVLLNLVGNAVKYNRAGGTVVLSCHRSDDLIHIEVTDDGPGIAREHQSLLFTPFERLGAERRAIEGTGIGLTLAQRLCEAMQGRLELRSEVGVGSTFTVMLPAAPAGELLHAGARAGTAR